MMRKIFLSLLSLYLTLNTGLCQENSNGGVRILFQGFVMDANTLSPVANSQILINRNFSSLSGNDGVFSFYVNRRDSVLFRSLGYKTATFVISDTLSGREFNAGIYLHSDTVSIAEVIIVPRYSSLRSDIMNGRSKIPSTMDNARYNVAISAYQGKNSQSKLGDPSSNYELLRQRQKVGAFEKGGIPSDRIVGINPLILIPAAYLLLKGVPEAPAPMKPELTRQEIEQINKKYLETINQRK